jgi:hypothetical protein
MAKSLKLLSGKLCELCRSKAIVEAPSLLGRADFIATIVGGKSY